MAETLKSRLLKLLPAGEWSDIEVIDDAGGMMQRYGAVHATATSVRHGGIKAYLKCIPERGASAGTNTRRIAGTERLSRVAQRIRDAEADPNVASVRILAVEQVAELPGLLIAMERVTPIRTIILAGQADRDLATTVLEELCSARCATWIHFDICPKNVGRGELGKCVFIDVDSLYPVASSKTDISMPAFKPNRLVADLYGECEQAVLNNAGFDPDLLRAKHDAELIVLAAECVLGLFDLDLSDAGVDEWVERAECSVDEREFWRHELKALIAGKRLDPKDLARRLRSLPRDTTMKFAEPIAQPQRKQLTFASRRTWADMDDVRRLLRREFMRPDEQQAYLDRLLELARAGRDQRWWQEALLVALSYQHHPKEAEAIATEALVQFPGNNEFRQRQQLARMWPSD